MDCNVATHRAWANHHLIVTEQCLRLFATHFPRHSVPAHTQRFEEKESSLAEMRFTNPHTGVPSLTHTQSDRRGSPSPPLLLPSPSGQFVALFWPESSFFLVVSVDLRLSESDSVYTLREVDKGVCAECAWVGVRDHWLTLTPSVPVAPRESEKTTSRRFSMFAHSSREKDSEKERDRRTPRDFVLRQYLREDAAHIAVCVCELSLNAESAESLCAAPQAVDLFSGLVVCVNAVSAASVASLSVAERECVSKSALLSHHTSAVHSRFYALHHSTGNGAQELSLVAVSPRASAVQCVRWDESLALCATLSLHDGTVNVLRLCAQPHIAASKDSHTRTLRMDALAMIQTTSLGSLSALRWCTDTNTPCTAMGLLLCESARGVWQYYLEREGEKEEETVWRIETIPGPLLLAQ